MKLTPLDIRKQEFSRRVRGVDEEEVKAFLQMVASQWEEIQDEQRRLDEKVRELDGKLEHYKRVEEALQEALRTARENAKDALETARQKAQIIIQEAEASAVHLKRDADDERRKMRRQIGRLTQRRDEIVSRLRAFLMSEMELLARFEGDDAVGFIKLMPSPERHVEEDADLAEAALDQGISAPALASLPAAEPEPQPALEPEAPLPAWAQFEDETTEPAAPAPSTETPAESEPSAYPELAGFQSEPENQSAPPSWARESQSEGMDQSPAPPAVEEPQPVLPPQPEVVQNAAPEPRNQDVEPLPEVLAQQAEAYSSDGDSVEHDVPSRESQASDTERSRTAENVEVDSGSDESLPQESNRSRWLSEHLFSAFRRSNAAGTDPESSDEPAHTASGIDNQGWEHHVPDVGKSRPDPVRAPEEEEEESFTVSSEEVERIRRILKGLE